MEFRCGLRSCAGPIPGAAVTALASSILGSSALLPVLNREVRWSSSVIGSTIDRTIDRYVQDAGIAA